MIDYVAQMLAMINAELGHPTAVRALIVGFVCSIGLTQIAKFSPQLIYVRDLRARWMIRLFAFGAAALPTWALWPEPGIAGVVVAIAVGLIAPTAYTIAVRVAVHFWPWLEGALSARPACRPPPSNDFHQGDAS